MRVSSNKAEIVILATPHNIGILTPEWLREKGSIDEKPKQAILLQNISLFESESFLIIANPDRLQLTAKRQTPETLETLAKVATKYIESSFHISHTALGLNFIWTLNTEGNESLPEIGNNIGDIKDFSPIFPGGKVSYGGIIYTKRDPYLLKLVIEPVNLSTSTYVFNFNYHHELKELDLDKIKTYVKSFLDLYNDSERTVTAISKGKTND